jgi:hypothetical protein
MESQNQEIVQAIEQLPCKLQMCWRAKLLRKHKSEEDFQKVLGECICGENRSYCLQVMKEFKEKNLLHPLIS